MLTDQPTCPCGLCGKPTPMLGTKRCDGCWELERRVRRDPELARRILAAMPGAPSAQALTEDEVFLAIGNVPITQKYVVDVAHAIERAVLAKLRAPAALQGRLNQALEGLREAASTARSAAHDLGGPVARRHAREAMEEAEAAIRALADAADAHIPEQKGESVQAYVQSAAGAGPLGAKRPAE